MKLSLPRLSFSKIRSGEYSRSVFAPLLVLAVFLLLRLSGRIDSSLTRENEYAAEILLQLLIFLFPAVVYLVLTGQNLQGKRLRLLGIGHLLMMVSGLAVLICGSLLLGLWCGGYETLTCGYDLYGVFVAKNDGSAGDVAYLILAYAFLPAVCEEFVFRSVLCAEYEKCGMVPAILMPALFFAMLHFDWEHFPSLLLAGLVLAFLTYATRTVISAMVVHFLFNLVSVFGKPYYQTVYDLGGEAFFVFLVTALFFLFSFIFCAEAARLYRSYADKNYSSGYAEQLRSDPDSEVGPAGFREKHPRIYAALSAFLSPTALICYVLYVAIILL